MPDREYTVYFEGKVTVEAQSDAEATQQAYDLLNDVTPPLQFHITSTDEGECVECDGTGEVSVDEDDGEGHTMRGTGTRKCLCKVEGEEPDRIED